MSADKKEEYLMKLRIGRQQVKDAAPNAGILQNHTRYIKRQGI
jgi:hypothetical protein